MVDIVVIGGNGAVGQQIDIPVRISGVSTGLSGFNMSATINNDAKFVDVVYPAYGLTLTEPVPIDGPSLTRISAADLGAVAEGRLDDFTLFTLVVELARVGRADIVLISSRLDDDPGNPILAAIQQGSVRTAAVLTTDELAKFRQAVAKDQSVSWDKPTINVALQAIEDVLEASAFDAETAVRTVVVNNARAQTTKDELDGGRVPLGLVSVVEDWLISNPPSVSTRSIDDAAITAFVTASSPELALAAAGMPVDQRAKLVTEVVKRRVGAAV